MFRIIDNDMELQICRDEENSGRRPAKSTYCPRLEEKARTEKDPCFQLSLGRSARLTYIPARDLAFLGFVGQRN